MNGLSGLAMTGSTITGMNRIRISHFLMPFHDTGTAHV